MKQFASLLFHVGICAFGYLFATSSITLAQVTSDDTVNTQINQNGDVAEITGGETRGGNLFHSFQDFSVGTGKEAFFDNADNISSIFNRVTGGNISNIDGLIRANGSADLFLINPAGIIFGENARLDIGGSFYGSTASGILFENGEFSAVDNLQEPILAINAPIGLSFRDSPEDIEVNATASANFDSMPFDDNLFGLRVPDGKTFALAGGNITANGGGIVAVGGQIELGAVDEAGIISLNFNNDNFVFDFPEELSKADVSLTNNAAFLVSGSGGGNIAVSARNIKILEGSGLFAGIFEGSQSANARAGDITLNATEKIIIASSTDNESNVANRVGNIQVGDLLVGITTQGSAGNISFNSNTFEGNGNFLISSVTSGAGDAGKISINAKESASFVGDGQSRSGILSLVGASARGNGGDVTINTPTLSMLDSGLILTTIGDGNTGNLRIEADDAITVKGRSQFQSTSLGNGDAGNITIDAPNSDVSFESSNTIVATIIASLASFPGITPEFAEIATTFFGVPRVSTGSSGDISITSRNLAITNGALLSTSTAGQAIDRDLSSDAGDINITVSDNFVLSANSQLLSSTVGQGNAGDVNIIAGKKVSLQGLDNTGANIRTTVEPLLDVLAENFTQVRQGGNINITAKSVSLANSSQIIANTFSEGNAGDLSIFADNIDIEGSGNFPSGLFAEVGKNATGKGGNLNLGSEQSPVGELNLTDGAAISTGTFGKGDAGNININSSQKISLDDGRIFSDVNDGAEGDAGTISFTTNRLSLTNESTIGSRVFGRGRGGNINLGSEQSPIGQLAVTDGSQISVSVFGRGVGGSLFVNTDNLNLVSGSILSSTAFEQGGNIELEIAENLTLDNSSIISAEATGDAVGGNVDINANFIVAFPGGDNDILANANRGRGGVIRINAESLLGIEERPNNPLTNDIDASSQVSGLDGTVDISTLDLNPVQRAAKLPSNVVKSEQTTQQACKPSRGNAAKNGLTILGKGGMVPEPGLPLNSLNIIIDDENDFTANIPKPIETAKGKIQPARGIKVTENGEIALTPYRTNSAGERLPEIKQNCDRA